MQFFKRHSGALVILLSCLALGLTLGACSDSEGEGSIVTGTSGRLLVQPLNVSFSQVALGETQVQDVTLTNIHPSESLTIYSVALAARDGGRVADLKLLDKPTAEFKLAAEESRTVKVEYRATGEANRAKIDVVSSDPNYGRETPFSLNVDTQANRPQISFSPRTVSFPPVGQARQRPLTIYNYGTAPLIIYDVGYSGSSEFSIDPLSDSEVVLQPYQASLAAQNPSAYGLEVMVHYRPQGAGSAGVGKIRVESNDTQEGTQESGRGIQYVDVLANAVAPCIMVDGSVRNIGPVPVGAVRPHTVLVTNCGSEALVISNIEILENSASNEFSLDFGSWAVEADGSLAESVTIAPNEDTTFRVDYAPREVGSDTGKLLIESNDPAQPEFEVDLVARGSDGVCPVASLQAKVRGETGAGRPTISATPLDYIVLDASGSHDPDGQVVSYEWTALQVPDGTEVDLGPTVEDSADADPSRREFRALLTGTYKLGLEVVDNEGFTSCNQAVATIVAIPNKKIHIELTWHNPEDPDETDANGSDLDLHFVKLGPGKWFESPYDIYFRNSNNSGGGIWNPESPRLDIDDIDGMGPENITLDDPVNCEWYGVGVHYYREAFGTAYATIRIYINENLVFEALNKPMARGNQFWDVGRIHWNQAGSPGFHVYEVDELMPARPAEQPPLVSQSMVNSGLCTIRDLY
ncbi:choice-of-anchor D domain-containing protein [Bradymonas sediminis]|uniref:HYDIN/VesB/CFA65-like Ig-like domain-containing protein n=1 Tax=Bradymonas sediminis TaxID=1548548 RepID=A0A2Z4FKZ0_9DELT|nr:choice-of-anchor D domain-containing protein [Bradymonas sediminis]AWV89629.1 hypothetical protein DN745_09890 [Bradymonas sediminis]TDP76631.1 hypothetical protein DFR33_102263 [Bradymonas sediminis]